MRTTSRTTAGLALTAAAAVLLAGCTSPAPEATGQAPSGAHLDPASTAALESLLDAGATAAVIDIRDGDEHVTAAFGTVDGEVAAEPDDQLRIASVTKTMTATVIMQLVEEGEFTLDTAVDDVVPGLLDSPEPVTVRQLLNHTSGLPDYFDVLVPDVAAYHAAVDVEHEPSDLIAEAQARPWSAAPGTAFSYSNANYVALGLLAEEVTGEELPELMRSRIFEPLGLDRTEYPTSPALPDGALRGSVLDGDETVDTSDGSPSIWGAGAAVTSTAGDVGTFFQALFAGELVSAESVQEMQAVGAEGYGLGILAGGDACGAQPVELVFGQRGNGIGYRVMAFGSPDGDRFVTVGWAGGTFDPATDPTVPPANDALVAALAATCD
ncbi:MAG: serine hydrolase domain-containing protein [Microbacterium sp.]